MTLYNMVPQQLYAQERESAWLNMVPQKLYARRKGKYVAEHGPAKAVCHCSELLGRKIPEKNSHMGNSYAYMQHVHNIQHACSMQVAMMNQCTPCTNNMHPCHIQVLTNMHAGTGNMHVTCTLFCVGNQTMEGVVIGCDLVMKLKIRK